MKLNLNRNDSKSKITILIFKVIISNSNQNHAHISVFIVRNPCVNDSHVKPPDSDELDEIKFCKIKLRNLVT